MVFLNTRQFFSGEDHTMYNPSDLNFDMIMPASHPDYPNLCSIMMRAEKELKEMIKNPYKTPREPLSQFNIIPLGSKRNREGTVDFSINVTRALDIENTSWLIRVVDQDGSYSSSDYDPYSELMRISNSYYCKTAVRKAKIEPRTCEKFLFRWPNVSVFETNPLKKYVLLCEKMPFVKGAEFAASIMTDVPTQINVATQIADFVAATGYRDVHAGNCKTMIGMKAIGTVDYEARNFPKERTERAIKESAIETLRGISVPDGAEPRLLQQDEMMKIYKKKADELEIELKAMKPERSWTRYNPVKLLEAIIKDIYVLTVREFVWECRFRMAQSNQVSRERPVSSQTPLLT